MLKFFRLPFATTGDKTAVPDAVDSNGNVSYSQGYGFDYQRQKTDPAAKNIERDKMNQIFFDITTAIAEIQAQGVPDYITSALNGGSAYSYGQYAIVKYSGAVYISLVAANTALPSDATKWALLPTPALLQQAANNSAVAGGTVDALTAAFTPAIASLPAAPGTLSVFVRAAGANATTTPTFKADGTAAKTIVKGANQALVAGDIAGAGHWLELQYDATLDKWVLQNPAYGVSAVAVASVQGAFKNLQLSTLGTTANIFVTADEIALEDSGNSYVTARAVSLTINSAAAGANGLDTGALSVSTWYSVWVIRKPDGTTAGVISLSATTPTMPSGYTFKARVGWIRTDGTANKYPLSMVQMGRRVQYKVAAGTNVTRAPLMASGTLGSPATPTWAAVATGAFVPPTAAAIDLFVHGSWTTGTAYILAVAPNNAYGAHNDSNNPPPLVDNNVSQTAVANARTLRQIMTLESSNVYAAFNIGPGQVILACAGWEDNI